ncbi:hypothetical protein CPC16_004439 [Podila verticillata]|nr:hypothetical protein CPC16_004439 [Podila verticillata]
MFQADSYISFHDLSTEGRFLWASPSITDCLGYDPEELIDKPSYSIIYPDDIPLTRIAHQENLMNDLVASQIVVRFICKDGRPVACVSNFSLCYDYIVNCTALVDTSASYKQIRAHSAVMIRMVGSRQEEFERIRRHHEAFAARFSWNPNIMEPEARACMILNRFSRSLGIMYASPSCEFIFKVDPEAIIGKPFLLFVRADDLGPFVEQANMAKSKNVITNLRFYFQSPNWPQEIPCEIMAIGTSDGIIVILRRCKPFVRRHLLTSPEYMDRAHAAKIQPVTSFDSTTSIPPSLESCGLSWSTTGEGEGLGRETSALSSANESPSTPPKFHNSPFTSRPQNPFNNNPLQQPPHHYQNRPAWNPLRSIPIGSINSIRNLDHEDKLRPLTEVLPNDPENTEESGSPLSPEQYGMRKHIREYEEDVDD